MQVKKSHPIIKWLPLLATAMSIVIIVIDSTVLNVSVNEIKHDLHITSQDFQWIITSYSLVLASLTVTGGRLGDMFGRKKMFMTGAILFGIGSLIASFSRSQMQLMLGWSVLEGIGAALMMPAGSALLVSNYKGPDRAKAFAIYGGLAGISAALGPIFGGFITEHFTWHWALRINVFIVVLLLLGSRFIKEARDKVHKNKLDFGGVGLSALGLGMLSYGFVKAPTYGWVKQKALYSIGTHVVHLPLQLSFAFWCMLIGLAILGVFVWQQKMRKRVNKEPLLDLELFKNRQFTSGAATMAMLALVQGGFVLVLPLFFGATKQYDALHQGFAIVPYSIGFFVAAILSLVLAKKFKPKRIIQAGGLVSFVGYLSFALSIGANSSAASIRLPLIIMGLGGGLMISLISNLTLSAVEPNEAGQASGVFSTFRNMGGTLGSAVVGAVLISSIISFVPKQLATVQLPVQVKKTLAIEAKNGTLPSKQTVATAISKTEGMSVEQANSITAAYNHAVDKAYADAAKRSLFIATALVGVAILVTTKLPNDLRGTGHDSEKMSPAAH